MKYEIVNLSEKKVVGLSARTSNIDENMTKVIGDLWNSFYKNGLYDSILNKVNYKALGIYSNYDVDNKDEYDVTVACEVIREENVPQVMVTRTIPAGKYAKFVVRGHMQKSVYKFWSELGKMNLNRNYKYDFEEYQNSDMENAEIHIYIGIN